MARAKSTSTAICMVFAGLLAGGTSPALASWFGSPTTSTVTVSDQAVAQIQTALDDQRYLDAGKLLDQALIGHSDDPRLVLQVGQISLARSRYNDALANFKIVDAVPSVGARAKEGEGIALSLLGRSDEAIIALQAAVTLDPKLWRAWNGLGTEFDRRRDWQKSEEAYSNAISGSGGSELVLNNRGFSRLSQKRLDDAVADFVSALNKRPDFAAARNNLRLAMALKGDYERAVAGATAADRAAIYNNVGFAAMLRGDYLEAKKFFSRAMNARGDYYSTAAANLEMMHELSGQDDRNQEKQAIAH